jgi:hypothetical protein
METKAADKSTSTKSAHIGVNELNYYYEVHGKGEPLLIWRVRLDRMFAPVLPMLANSRQVIGVDLHGHGRILLVDREMSRSTCPPS